MITEKEAVKRITEAVWEVSSDPNNLPNVDSKEGLFLMEVYELMVKYNLD